MADYKLSASITGDSSGFTKALDQASAKLNGLSNKVSGVGSNIAKAGMKITAIGAGLTAGITVPFIKAVGMTSEFDDSMNKVRVTLLNGQKATAKTKAEFEKLNSVALDLAAKFPVNAQEVSDSMLELAKSGQNANDIMDMMPGILQAAAASGEDVATVSNTVSAALAGFGLEASSAARVADILTNSANASKAGVADMGEVFKYAAPISHTLGISMEELAAASGLMMDKGLEASQVGTSLTMAFTKLSSPTAKAKKVMTELGFSAVDAKGNFKSLEQIVRDLNAAMADYTPSQKVAALATMMDTEAASKFMTLMDAGADSIHANTEAIKERGTAEQTASEMQKSLSANLETLTGSFQSVTMSIMQQNVPAIQALVQWTTGLLDKFNDLPTSTKSVIATFFAVAAAIGPILTTIGPLMTGFGGLTKILGFLVSPAGLAIAAITALGALFVYEMSTNAQFAASVKNMADKVVQAFSIIKDALSSFISGDSQGATDLLSGLIPESSAQKAS